MTPKGISLLVACGLVVILTFMSFGINTNGYRVVVQLPSGDTYVKFTPGPYLIALGSSYSYPDFITYDFDQDDNNDDARGIVQHGIGVRYQEGGTGTVYGQARFKLPETEEAMIALHRAYKSPEGVAYKLIKPSVDEIEVLTANLMTSDESYMEKRNTYGEWARDQLQNGKYITTVQNKEIKEEGTDKTVSRLVPVIAIGSDGLAKHGQSDLKNYGVTLASVQHTNPDYEQKTIDQIQARRAATMAIITAKAEAERAKQDAVTAQAEGEKNVTIEKYKREVEKAAAIVVAEQQKAVATLAAEQKVEVAKQELLEQQQKKLAAAEYKEAETLKGEGDAAYKKAVIEADGALQQKLATYEKVMTAFAVEFGKQKWVPEIQFGQTPSPVASETIGFTGATNTSTSVLDLINMLNVKTARDLSLDMSIPSKKK